MWHSVDERHAARFVCPAPAPYLSVAAFFTELWQRIPGQIGSRYRCCSMEANRSPPLGERVPNNRVIWLASNVLHVRDLAEQMPVSATNYNDGTFHMKFEVGDP